MEKTMLSNKNFRYYRSFFESNSHFFKFCCGISIIGGFFVVIVMGVFYGLDLHESDKYNDDEAVDADSPIAVSNQVSTPGVEPSLERDYIDIPSQQQNQREAAEDIFEKFRNLPSLYLSFFILIVIGVIILVVAVANMVTSLQQECRDADNDVNDAVQIDDDEGIHKDIEAEIDFQKLKPADLMYGELDVDSDEHSYSDSGAPIHENNLRALPFTATSSRLSTIPL